MVEIFGPESSGKTTLVYHVIAEAQRRGGICAFIDAEHAMDPQYARRIGVNIDDLLVSQPDTGEQALEICELLVRSGALDVVAVDSVAALTPKAEIEGEMGDSHVGLQARLMSQALRKLAGTLNRTDTICLFTNQLREKIGVMFGSPETTPGGRALKFYASVRLDIRRIETLKDGAEAFGNRVRVKVVKNKVAPPFKQAEFDIIYGSGISWEGTVLDVALERKIVAEVGLVLQLRRRAARPGPSERDGVPRREPRPRAADPRAHPGRGGGRADRLGAAPAARSAAAAGRRRGRRGAKPRSRRQRRRRPPQATMCRRHRAPRRGRPGRGRARRLAVADAAARGDRPRRARRGLRARPERARALARERRRLRALDVAAERCAPATDPSGSSTTGSRRVGVRAARTGSRRSATLQRAGLVDDARFAPHAGRERSPTAATATPRSATTSSDRGLAAEAVAEALGSLEPEPRARSRARRSVRRRACARPVRSRGEASARTRSRASLQEPRPAQ